MFVTHISGKPTSDLNSFVNAMSEIATDAGKSLCHGLALLASDLLTDSLTI
jgi:hypothetical protein